MCQLSQYPGSQKQNEISYFKRWGKDIIPHNEKLEKRDLDKEYRDRYPQVA